jgi:hypothetical protein
MDNDETLMELMECPGKDSYFGVGLDRDIEFPVILSPQEILMIYLSKQNFTLPRNVLEPFLRHKELEKYVSDFTTGMDLRSIVFYLKINDIKSYAIYDDLVTTLHDDALEYSTKALWLRQERLTRFSEPSHDLAEDRQVTTTDQAILSALTVEPFASVCDITWLTCLHRSTISLYFACLLRFTVRHLRWIPHLMTNEQKHNRVRDSQIRLEILQTQQSRSWYDIATLGESWCYLNTDLERR